MGRTSVWPGAGSYPTKEVADPRGGTVSQRNLNIAGASEVCNTLVTVSAGSAGGPSAAGLAQPAADRALLVLELGRELVELGAPAAHELQLAGDVLQKLLEQPPLLGR